MDIGTSGYTQYAESVDILSYRVEHNLLEEGIQEGLIHSHNTMSAFFSGTDQSTLNKEGAEANHFLSLIVNNAGQYVARFTRKVVTNIQEEAIVKSKESSYYNTFGNRKVILSENKEKIEKLDDSREEVVVEFYDLDIEKQTTAFSFQEIDERLSEIRKAKTPKTTYGNYGQRVKSKYKSLFDDSHLGSDYDLYSYSPNYDWYNQDWYNQTATKPKVEEEKKTEASMFEEYRFNPQKIEELATQLLTGSIFINPKSIKLNDWISKMDKLYEKRFGNLSIKENQERVIDWIDGMLDFIIYETDEKLEKKILETDLNGDYLLDVWDFCVVGLYEYLDDIEVESKVLDLIMNRLAKRLPDEAFTV